MLQVAGNWLRVRVILLLKVMPGRGSRRKDKRRKKSSKEESKDKFI
jgi:hypothetical protein